MMLVGLSLLVAPMTPHPVPHRIPAVWQTVADCESGEWDATGEPIPGTRDWSYDDGRYEGGLNFAPATWDWLAPATFPPSASDATPWQQVRVARRVLTVQGWDAWPVCSRKTGVAP